MKILKTDDTPEISDLFDTKERIATSASSSPDLLAVTLKGSVFTLPVIKLSTANIDAIAHGLENHLASALEFFKDAPVVVDLTSVGEDADACDFAGLAVLLKRFRLVCVAVQNGTASQHKAAVNAGLAVLSGLIKVHPKYPQLPEQTGTQNTIPPEPEPVAVKDVAESPVFTGATKVVNHPIRSGQRVYARGGDLILLAAVNAGAEIMADGNIHIYGPLRGRALAGVSGNTSARIFCHSLEAELVAIAGGYRVFEDDIPEDLYKKSAHIYLDGEQLKITVIENHSN